MGLGVKRHGDKVLFLFVCQPQEFKIIPSILFHLSTEEAFIEEVRKYTDE